MERANGTIPRLSERVLYTLRRLLTIPFYVLGWTLCWIYCRASGWRWRVVRQDGVLRSGGAVYVINHPRTLDSVYVGLTTGRMLSFLAKREYFTEKSLKGRLVSLTFWLVWQIPTDRTGGKAMNALDEAARIVRNGGRVAVHGEGTRSKDGRLNDMHTGFVRISKGARAPIIPTAVVYDDTERRVIILYGSPIFYEKYKDMTAHELAELVTDRIQLLGGQQRSYKRVSPYRSSEGSVSQ